MRPYLYLLILFSITASSCTPLRVLRMEPAADQIDSYLYGNAVATSTAGAAEVSTSFYDADNEYVVLHVEIKNIGTQAIDYDPVEATLSDPSGGVLGAVDPEVELLTYDLDQIKKIRTNRVMAVAGSALAVAGTVVAATSNDGFIAAGDNFTGINQTQLYTDLAFTVLDATVALGVVRQGVDPDVTIPSSGERAFWLEYAMRRTTIRPGEIAIGKLVFPRTLLAGTFQLAIPVEGEVLTFDFIQQIYR